MKKPILLILCILLFVACNTDNNDTIETDLLNYSLISPDNVSIATSAKQLNFMITAGKGKVIDIQYTKTDEKNTIIAKIDYQINNTSMSTILTRGVVNFKFPNDAIININSKPQLKNEDQDDIYISCSGGGCCYPSGTYDPNSQLFTTSCKCEGGNNSACIMRVGKNPPEEIKQ